jgi:hypothetical protein
VGHRLCNCLRAHDGHIRTCIFPPLPPRQINHNG